MKNILFTIILLFNISFVNAQHKRAYQLYNAQGEKVSYENMLAAFQDADIIYLASYIIILSPIGCNTK